MLLMAGGLWATSIAQVRGDSKQSGAINEPDLEQVAAEAAVQARLRVVESLLGASDQGAAALSVDDVLRVLLESAIEFADAHSGSIDFFEQRGLDLAVARTVTTEARSVPDVSAVEIPLTLDGHRSTDIARIDYCLSDAGCRW